MSHSETGRVAAHRLAGPSVCPWAPGAERAPLCCHKRAVYANRKHTRTDPNKPLSESHRRNRSPAPTSGQVASPSRPQAACRWAPGRMGLGASPRTRRSGLLYETSQECPATLRLTASHPPAHRRTPFAGMRSLPRKGEENPNHKNSHSCRGLSVYTPRTFDPLSFPNWGFRGLESGVLAC